jgi:uncharacterized protein
MSQDKTTQIIENLSEESREAVRQFLTTQSTLALATVKANGDPQIAPLFYVSDDELNLYWLSSANSLHSINLTSHPQVAVTIYPTVWQWIHIRGLQIEGKAQTITDERIREEILRRYLLKFNLPASFDGQIAASTLYQLKPTWLRWLDNSVKFGFKAETTELNALS